MTIADILSDACSNIRDYLDTADADYGALGPEIVAVLKAMELIRCKLDAVGLDDNPIKDLQEFYESHDAVCKICGGPAVPLGMLGRREHYRCRDCGFEASYLLEIEK